jgi:hypothetical protein
MTNDSAANDESVVVDGFNTISSVRHPPFMLQPHPYVDVDINL